MLKFCFQCKLYTRQIKLNSIFQPTEYLINIVNRLSSVSNNVKKNRCTGLLDMTIMTGPYELYVLDESVNVEVNSLSVRILFVWSSCPLWLFSGPPVVDIQLLPWLIRHKPLGSVILSLCNYHYFNTIATIIGMFISWEFCLTMGLGVSKIGNFCSEAIPHPDFPVPGLF